MSLLHRYPGLSLHLHLCKKESYSISHDASFSNLCLKNGMFYQGQEELTQWKKTVIISDHNLIYIYGLGLGLCYLTLKEWLSEDLIRNLIFLEDDPLVFLAFLSMPYAQELIDHPQVHLKWIFNPKEWDLVLEELSITYPFEKIIITALASYKKKSLYKRIVQDLLRKTTFWAGLAAEHISAPFLHYNIVSNIPKIGNSSYVNHWVGAFKNVPAIICGAGFSLQNNAQELLYLRDHALIIGGGSTLSALSHLNIRPHIGIAVDPNPQEEKALEGCHYTDLPFIFANRLYHSILKRFQGPYGYVRSFTGNSFEAYIEDQLGLKDSLIGSDLPREAASVTTLAVALAVFWGCNPIILTGVDLAYAPSSKQSYSAGVFSYESSSKTFYRKNFQGKRVKTLLKWILEQQALDWYAHEHPHTTFIHTASTGLGFKNICYQSLSSLITSQSFSSFDGDKAVLDLMNNHSLNFPASQIETLFATIENSLQSSLSFIESLLKEIPYSGKSIFYESQLQEELAYSLLLRTSSITFEKIHTARRSWTWEKHWSYLLNLTKDYLVNFSSIKIPLEIRQ